MAVINIISRDVFTPGLTIWRFHISPTDAASVMANHLSLKITMPSGDRYPSLSASPYSEIYFGGTQDPYTLVWSVVDNGGDDWSINFIYPVKKTYFTDINDWAVFNVDTIAPPIIPPTTINSIFDIRTRSPYLIVTSGTTGTTFNESKFTIKQFEGDIYSTSAQTISYIKNKQKITPTQSNIWININNLIREDLESDIDYFKDNDYTIGRNLSTNESKWVHVDIENLFNDSLIKQDEIYFFAVDGYIEPNELQGLPNILLTGNKRYMYKYSNQRIYFKTNNLLNVTYSSNTITSTPIVFSGDSDMNFGYVKSIKIANNLLPLGDDKITYTFNYSGSTSNSIEYNMYDECKYDVYDLVFKNKYGIMESLSLSKKSSKVLNITSNDYLKNIVDLNGDFNINKHTSKQYNVSGEEEWTLNTDYLPEYMNAPIKELMLSEEMWLIDNIGNIYPIIRLDQNISFKTSLNDKLIQYTIKVKLSHKTIKTIL